MAKEMIKKEAEELATMNNAAIDFSVDSDPDRIIRTGYRPDANRYSSGKHHDPHSSLIPDRFPLDS